MEYQLNTHADSDYTAIIQAGLDYSFVVGAVGVNFCLWMDAIPGAN